MQLNVILLCSILFTTALSIASSANILDLIWNEDGTAVKGRDENSDDDAPKSCACKGPTCVCCVDFNLTYIDLGGPGCVRMKYLSQEEGIAVNISYGQSLLHSEQVKGPNPEPTCMSLLTSLAQICARFVNILPHDDGLHGCLSLEPKLLGTVTTRFNMGCFTASPKGMTLESDSNSTIASIIASETETLSQNDTELNEDELLAVVNESAEQGLAFFSNLFGLSFGKPEVDNHTDSASTHENA